MRVASIEPSPEGADKTPVSSVSTPNLTTPPEISACAASGAFFCAAAAASGQVAATLPRRAMNSRRLIVSPKGSQDIQVSFSTNVKLTPVREVQR